MKIVNRKAFYNYELLERFEAGIALTGAEVKSIKSGRIILDEAYVKLLNDGAYLVNAHIPAYAPSGDREYDPIRSRKLLLNKRELTKIAQRINEKGLTIVPVSCYTKHHLVKIEVAIAKGKKEYEKRESIKKKDIERDIANVLKGILSS